MGVLVKFKFFLVRILEFIKIKVLKYDPKWEFPNGIEVGEGTYGFDYKKAFLYLPEDKIKIGKYTSIAADVSFIASGEHYYNRVSSYPFYANLLKLGNSKDTKSNGPIEIGNDVWIGHGAVILSGVSIGNGAVIAANSLVVKNVAPYTVVGGVPAKKIKRRFSEDVTVALERIKWWNWGKEVIAERISDFYDLTVDEFVKKYEK